MPAPCRRPRDKSPGTSGTRGCTALPARSARTAAASYEGGAELDGADQAPEHRDRRDDDRGQHHLGDVRGRFGRAAQAVDAETRGEECPQQEPPRRCEGEEERANYQVIVIARRATDARAIELGMLAEK